VKNLPVSNSVTGINHSKLCDLSIVLGTSMVVRPACNLPQYAVKSGGKMVICNRQITPFDDRAALILRGDVDDVLFLLMKELNIDIPDKTAEGFSIIKPTMASIELKHQKAIARINLKKKSPVAHQISDKLDTFADSIAKQRSNQHNINGEKGAKLTVPNKGMNSHIFINNCEDCIVSVTVKAVKITISHSKNTIINLENTANLLSGTIELINCEKVTILTKISIPTIQIDNCKDCKLTCADKNYFKLIVSSNCQGTTVIQFNVTSVIPQLSDLKTESDPAISQLITFWKSGEIRTEMLIREGQSGFAPASIHAENQARDAKLDAAIENYIKNSLTIQKSTGKN